MSMFILNKIKKFNMVIAICSCQLNPFPFQKEKKRFNILRVEVTWNIVLK